MPTSWLPSFSLNMLIKVGQHICRYIVHPRNIMYFQVQFRKTLQLASLVSIEMGLNEYVY